MPARSFRPVVARCSTPSRRNTVSVATAAAIGTAPPQNEPVTKIPRRGLPQPFACR